MICFVALVAALAGAPNCAPELRNARGLVAPEASATVESTAEPKLPVLVNKVQPRYPFRWKKAQGKVVLLGIVGADGAMSDVCVLKRAGPEAFADAAVEAVSQWIYEPATIDGRAVAVYHNVVVVFRFPDAQGFYEPLGPDDPIPVPFRDLTLPVLRSRPPLEYPTTAQGDRPRGWAVVTFVIRADGSVRDVRVKRSSGDRGIEAAAVAAVETWTYQPARYRGTAQAVHYTARVDFDPDSNLNENTVTPPPASASDDR